MEPALPSHPEAIVHVAIVHDSWAGHAQAVAEVIAQSARSAPGQRAVLVRVDAVTREEVYGGNALVMGGPVRQRTTSWPTERLVDLVREPAGFYDDRAGRVGMALAMFPKTSMGFGRHSMHWKPYFHITGADMVPLPTDWMLRLPTARSWPASPLVCVGRRTA